MFSFSRNYFSWHMHNIQKKISFAFWKHPIQNKRLLRLQTVCCNSLACSKNNGPHEGVCSLAITSLPGWFDSTLFFPQSLSCYRAPWMPNQTHMPGLALPFSMEQSNSWHYSQTDIFFSSFRMRTRPVANFEWLTWEDRQSFVKT